MRGSRLSALCAVGGLLLLAVISARGTSAVPGVPQDLDIGEGPPPLRGDVSDPGDPVSPPWVLSAEEPGTLPGVVGVTSLLVVAFLLLGAVLVLVLRGLRHRRREREWAGPAETDEDGDSALPRRLRHAAEAARAALTGRPAGPPGDAVIAAWLVLEDAAAREGAGREPHQTPTEFTAALLGRHTTDEQALDRLRTLYGRARFGVPGSIGEQDVHEATAALDGILLGFDHQHQPAGR